MAQSELSIAASGVLLRLNLEVLKPARPRGCQLGLWDSVGECQPKQGAVRKAYQEDQQSSQTTRLIFPSTDWDLESGTPMSGRGTQLPAVHAAHTYTVEARKLEYDHRPTPNPREEGKTAQNVPDPYSNSLEPTVSAQSGSIDRALMTSNVQDKGSLSSKAWGSV